MAKELPYFKFEPSEWENGNIQLCTPEAKGLFIELCCSYWIRLGDLPYEFVLMKHCNNDDTLLKELEKKQIIKIKKDLLVITFLDVQFAEFDHKSLKAKESANIRWQKHRNANASDPQCETDAIRGEERRVDKKIERVVFKQPTIEEIKEYCKEKDIHMDCYKFFYHFESNGWKVGSNKMKDWKAAANKWSLSDFNKPEPTLVKSTPRGHNKVMK